MNLDIITHYHLPDRKPFLSLSDLKGDINDPIFQEILNRHKVDSKYNRRYGIEYLNTRSTIESKLRNCFIKRSGKPTRKYPLYFVLGESKWFEHLNDDHIKIQIPIASLPQNKVSITFPDSYVAMTAKDKSFYEKVFFLHELEELIHNYGEPCDEVPKTYNKYWEGDFELYYEVQVWDDKIIEPYL